MNSLVEIALLLGAPYTLALAIETMVKRRRERQIVQNRAILVAAGNKIAAARAECLHRLIAAKDLEQRMEMAVLYGCPLCGAKPREVADVVVCCGDRSLPIDHPDRFVIGCARCVPAMTRVRA